MPSGQYFYTNPQAAAIANNLAKVFFGDAEARAEQARIEGIMLENQLRQQQIDENNTVNDARGSISRLFGSMSPDDVQKNAPAFYSEFARLAGRDGFGANDGSTLIRGFAANAGASDNTIARAFVGAGNGLGINEGVSLSDRDTLLRRHQDPAYYGIDVNDRRARDLDETVVTNPGATVYKGGKVFTADPRAIQNEIATQKPGKSAAGKTYDLSPSATTSLANFMGKTYPGLKTLPPDQQAMILDRAGVYYQQTGNASSAAARAVSEMTDLEMQAPSSLSSLFGGKPTQVMKFKEGAATSGFVDTPSDAATNLANGVVSPTASLQNSDQKTDVVAAPEPQGSQPVVMGPADKPEGTVQRNKRTGQVRKVINGQWVILDAPAQ